jgi:large subunit ribosomal protein L25
MSLTLQIRGKEKSARLRSRGFIPGIVYGDHVTGSTVEGSGGTVSIFVALKEFEQRMKNEQMGKLWDVQIEGEKEPLKAIVKEVQSDPVSDIFTHVDFYSVAMDKKITVEIPVHGVGQSMAVKSIGGILLKNLDALEIECLPKDLIPYIEVNIEKLDTIGSAITIADLNLPEGVALLGDPGEVIVMVKAPRSEAELAALNAVVDETSAVEAIASAEPEKKPEEEEDAKGAEGGAKKKSGD